MSKSNTLENALLLLIFNNTDITGVGDAGGLLGSASAGNLYVGFHTGDPGEAGDQTTNETGYGGYARVAVARSGSGWTVSGNSVSPAADVTGVTSTDSGDGDLTHFSVGTASSGAGKLLYSGTLTPNIAIDVGVTPILDASTTITED